MSNIIKELIQLLQLITAQVSWSYLLHSKALLVVGFTTKN